MRRDVMRDGCLRDAVMNVETSLAERMLLQVRLSAQSPFPGGVKVAVLAHCSAFLPLICPPRFPMTGAAIALVSRAPLRASKHADLAHMRINCLEELHASQHIRTAIRRRIQSADPSIERLFQRVHFGFQIAAIPRHLKSLFSARL